MNILLARGNFCYLTRFVSYSFLLEHLGRRCNEQCIANNFDNLCSGRGIYELYHDTYYQYGIELHTNHIIHFNYNGIAKF